jgi:hypothetical protein
MIKNIPDGFPDHGVGDTDKESRDQGIEKESNCKEFPPGIPQKDHMVRVIYP